MKKKKFLLLDPFLKNTTLLESAFKSWLTYYESRNDREISDWATEKPLHALQTDSNNCGIFVINYISRFILDHYKSRQRKMFHSQSVNFYYIN